PRARQTRCPPPPPFRFPPRSPLRASYPRNGPSAEGMPGDLRDNNRGFKVAYGSAGPEGSDAELRSAFLRLVRRTGNLPRSASAGRRLVAKPRQIGQLVER